MTQVEEEEVACWSQEEAVMCRRLSLGEEEVGDKEAGARWTCVAWWWCWSPPGSAPAAAVDALHCWLVAGLTLAWDSSWDWCWSWWTWDCTGHNCCSLSCCCCHCLMSSCCLRLRTQRSLALSMSGLMWCCWHCSRSPRSQVCSIHWHCHHCSSRGTLVAGRTAPPAPGSCPASASSHDPSSRPWTRPPLGTGSSGSRTSDCCLPLQIKYLLVLVLFSVWEDRRRCTLSRIHFLNM